MTKRAHQKFKRNKRDLYETRDANAVIPLLPHLSGVNFFDEPCAGGGGLVRHMHTLHDSICREASDINPGFPSCKKRDVFDITGTDSDVFITNPPWSRPILHPLIIHLSDIAPTWLLFDADWIHTKQSIPYMERCCKIVSVGRVSWMGNGVSGFDNCAWYLFDKYACDPTKFYGRTL